jgi:hypothetical protein
MDMISSGVWLTLDPREIQYGSDDRFGVLFSEQSGRLVKIVTVPIQVSHVRMGLVPLLPELPFKWM